MEKTYHLLYATEGEKIIVFETLIIDIYYKKKKKLLFKEKRTVGRREHKFVSGK